VVYHVLNRRAGRRTLFAKRGDYDAFEQVLAESLQRVPVRLLCYCLMPTHWHLVLWPRGDGDLSQFMHWLTVTHAQRYHAHHRTAGIGPIYQGRFKSFLAEKDEHFLALARYVERNALRANLVERAEDWRWCSLWVRRRGAVAQRALLSRWPVDEPVRWLRTVNTPQSESELASLRRCVTRGRPWGNDGWVAKTAAKFDLTASLRPVGRPRKSS
jgi:putative transposase